jgi:hypothetical protein
MTSARSARSLRIEAEEALIHKRVFKVMAERDWQLFIKIAEIACADADPALAVTDPARFRLLRDGVTAWHTKGLGSITPEGIRARLVRYGIPIPEMPEARRLDQTDRELTAK